MFAVFVFAALAAGTALFLLRAQEWGLDRKRSARFLLHVVAAGFLGSHVTRLAYDPSLASLRGMASFGGIFGALAGASLWLRLDPTLRAQSRRLLDLLAWCFPFAWLIGRAGCVAVQDHPGLPSSHWLAARFPDGDRFDLALIEMVFTGGIAAMFLFLRRRGYYLPIWLVTYGAFRIALDLLHDQPPRWLGVTPDQAFGTLTLLTGIAVWRSAGSTKPTPLRDPARCEV